MRMKAKNRCRSRARDRVEDISGTGFAGPEEHATAMSAWESPCDERENRNVMGSVVRSLLKPCCGDSSNVSSGGARRSKTKVKIIKQKTNGKECKPKLKSSNAPHPSSHCGNDSAQPGPSNPLIQADSGYASGSLLFPTSSHARDISIDDDNLSVIGIGELSERAQEEWNARWSVNSSSSNEPTSSEHEEIIPGVPDYLTVRQSNKVKLSPIQPLYLSTAMRTMKRALAKAEEEEEIPTVVPIRFRKPKPLSKKQQQLQDKLVAKLKKHAALGERQMMKAKLADKRKAVKEEFEKVTLMKKRAKVNNKLEKLWEEVDRQPSKPTREQTLKENDTTIEKHNAAIQRLEQEIEMLKGKQECKQMRHELVRTKAFKGIVSDTLRQCEATKLRRRYFSLGREIDRLWDEMNSRQRKVQELVPLSSCSTPVVENDDQSAQQGDVTPPTNVVLVKSLAPEDEDVSTGVPAPHMLEEESTVEEDPFVRYGFAPPVHERKPENNTLIALFIGESSRKQHQDENECLIKFEESCYSISESQVDNTLSESFSVDSSLESQSLSSFELEEEETEQDQENENPRSKYLYCH